MIRYIKGIMVSTAPLAKVEVVGSNPIARSNFFTRNCCGRSFRFRVAVLGHGLFRLPPPRERPGVTPARGPIIPVREGGP